MSGCGGSVIAVEGDSQNFQRTKSSVASLRCYLGMVMEFIVFIVFIVKVVSPSLFTATLLTLYTHARAVPGDDADPWVTTESPAGNKILGPVDVPFN